MNAKNWFRLLTLASLAAVSVAATPSFLEPSAPEPANASPEGECQLPDVAKRARLFPAQHSTLVSDDQLRIGMRRGREKVTAEDLAALARTVSLTMQPEGTTVEVSALPSIVEGSGELRIAPTSELSDGWYELRATLPEGFEWPDGSTGTKASSFRVGSDPVIQNVAICDKAAGRASVEVELSEPVDPSSNAVFDLVDESGNAVGCKSAVVGAQRYANPPPLYPPPGGEGGVEPVAAAPEPRLVFDCPTDSVRRDLRIRGRSGQVKSLGRALSFEPALIRQARFTRQGPSCVVHSFDAPQFLLAKR